MDLSIPEQFFAVVTSPGLTPVLESRSPLRVGDTMYPQNIALVDIDKDGKLDIVFDSYNTGIAVSRRTTY